VYRAMHARTTTELGKPPSARQVRPPGPPVPAPAEGLPPASGPVLPPLRVAAAHLAPPDRRPALPPDDPAAGRAPGAVPGRAPGADGSDRGSHAEFDAFYRDRWDGVARALALALGDRDLAVDATDEAMARAYPRWDQLRGYDNPAGWVYRVGLNWARSHHRRLARKLPFSHPETVDPAPVADPAVRRALLDLPIRQRSVVVCRLFLDWSVEETAAALGVRPGTVRSRLHRALQSLEASLHHLR
jgi:RNA polymerase sigma factor (sigma-70 family)